MQRKPSQRGVSTDVKEESRIGSQVAAASGECIECRLERNLTFQIHLAVTIF